MKQYLYISMLSFILLLFLSCKKKEENTPPFIQFVSITPAIVTQFVDPVVIKINYEEAQGDIGHPNPDSLTLFIQDSRLSVPDYIHVPPLTPDTNLKIKGDIDIEIGSPFLLGNGGTEYIQYTIKIRDNNGLWSNEIATSEIEVHN